MGQKKETFTIRINVELTVGNMSNISAAMAFASNVGETLVNAVRPFHIVNPRVDSIVVNRDEGEEAKT